MKKYRFLSLLSVCVFVSVCGSVSAQEQHKTPVSLTTQNFKIATNPFRQNWEISLGIQGLSFYSNQEIPMHLSNGLFSGFRTNMSLALSVAKWFSPEVGMRTKISGLWGRSISSNDKTSNAVHFMHIREDVMVNLANIICDYDSNRRWGVSPYVGVGMTRNFTHNENALALDIGVTTSYRIGKRVKTFLELSFNIMGDEFDNQIFTSKNIFRNHDRYLAAELGLTLELGQNQWKKVVDIDDIEVVPWQETQKELKRLNRKAKGLQDKLEYLENKDSIKETIINNVPEVSIFFEIGSHELTHRGQLENIKELVQTAIKDNRTIVVTGYADSFTGNSSLNERLSQKRAETIVKELLKMGVNIEQIKAVIGGGVSTLDVIKANRRVVLTLEY